MEYKLNGSDIVVSLQDVHIDTNVGESAKLEVQTAVNFIKSGQAEVNAVADARTAEFNANAAEKIAIVNAGAESASQSADSASDSANAAQGYASNAEDSATAAAASAESINFAKSTNTDLETDGEPSDDYVPTQKAVKTYVDDGLASKVDGADLATVAFTGEYDDVVGTPDLATVATSGSYNDLTNKPTIPTVNNATLTISKNGSSVGTFTANASSAKTINITVPTSASDVGALPNTTKYGASLTLSFTSQNFLLLAQLKDQNGNNLGNATGAYLPLGNFATHSEVSGAVSGLASENWVLAQGYTTNVGTVTSVNNNLPDADGNVTISIPGAVWGNISGTLSDQTDLATALGAKYDASNPDGYTTNIGTVTSVNNTSPDSAGNVTLSIPAAQVNSDWNADSGVAQILNKPTIPTVNDGTLTIQVNSTDLQTFTANQSGSVTANIPVPTDTGDLTNGAGFITSSALSDYVTTNTNQEITGEKTFKGQKRIIFKQSTSTDKLGFTLKDNSNNERGYLEYNPSNTVDGANVFTLGSYSTNTSYRSIVGFRYYDGGNSAAYNLLAPLAGNAKSSFSLTTSYTNFYLPLGFTNGVSTVLTANTGVVNISTLLPTVNNSTITITQGGTTKGSFTLNQSSGATIALDAGGGSSYTAGTNISIASDVISTSAAQVILRRL